MRVRLLFLCLAGLLSGATCVFGQTLDNAFDSGFGANSYQGGFSTANWVTEFPDNAAVGPNSGADFFATANGTAGDFPGVGLTKDLGATILNQTYTISLEVAYYDDRGTLTPVVFSDFSVLRIGGANGAVTWSSTPTPTNPYQWVQWTGTYSPAPADVGTDFTFQAVLDLEANRSLAIDGPVTATPAPEPSAVLLLAAAGITLGGLARCRRAAHGVA